MRVKGILFAAALAAVGLTSCARSPQRAPEVVAATVKSVPLDPADKAWAAAPEHLAKLVPQDLVEPRLVTPTTPELLVRALVDGSSIAFRLEWADEDPSDRTGPLRMADACAVQIPVSREKDLPDPQMGQGDRAVQVTYWRADWQAAVDGRVEAIADLYPRAAVDHYPFEAKPLEANPAAQQEMAGRYAPAKILGNLRSGPRKTPVEPLISAGPGTLTPVAWQGEDGKGVFAERRWQVVIKRRMPEGLRPGDRTAVAFAVWQGSKQESGARKMRTGWIGLLWRASS